MTSIRQTLMRTTSIAAVSLVATLGSGGDVLANYACGMASLYSGSSGPPSFSATEATTAQVLEKVRERRDEQQQVAALSPAPAQPAAAAQPAPAPAAQIQTTPPAPAPKASATKQAPRPAAQKSAPVLRPAPRAERAPAAYRGLKDYDVAAPDEPSRSRGAWAAGFVDHERRDARNSDAGPLPESRKTTAGAMAGLDWTVRRGYDSQESFTFGLAGGYSHSKTKSGFVDLGPVPASANSVAEIEKGRETVEGGFWGLYGVYAHRGFSIDGLLKVDHLSLDSTTNILERSINCGVPDGTPVVESLVTQSANITNFTAAANIQRRFQLTDRAWWEPTAGFRYSYTDLSSVRASIASTQLIAGDAFAGAPNGDFLSPLRDGEALRLQVGARIGRTDEVRQGVLWTNIVTGLLYSDVHVEGFSVSSTGGSPAADDEGKLRALGQYETRITDVKSGVTYFGEVQVRGGEDLLGVGGRAGVRVEW